MATVWLAAREWRWAWSTELLVSIHPSPWVQARVDDGWGYLQLHVDGVQPMTERYRADGRVTATAGCTVYSEVHSFQRRWGVIT